VVSAEKKDLILATLAELFATGDRNRWVAAIRSVGLVAAPVNTLLEASNDPNIIANGYVAEKRYPELGETLKVHGSPWQFSETPAKIGVAPKLGEHSAEVLGELGYSAADIADLSERGII
jgi:crotonobetainyl-CoA:carnitine CoA-transferase CaiB-like acyl-CoA transferase